jgi:hypothetical protein
MNETPVASAFFWMKRLIWINARSFFFFFLATKSTEVPAIGSRTYDLDNTSSFAEARAAHERMLPSVSRIRAFRSFVFALAVRAHASPLAPERRWRGVRPARMADPPTRMDRPYPSLVT